MVKRLLLLFWIFKKVSAVGLDKFWTRLAVVLSVSIFQNVDVVLLISVQKEPSHIAMQQVFEATHRHHPRWGFNRTLGNIFISNLNNTSSLCPIRRSEIDSIREKLAWAEDLNYEEYIMTDYSKMTKVYSLNSLKRNCLSTPRKYVFSYYLS